MEMVDGKKIFKSVARRLGYDVSSPAALRAMYCEAMEIAPEEASRVSVNDWLEAAIMLKKAVGPCKYAPEAEPSMEEALTVPAATGPRGPAH